MNRINISEPRLDIEASMQNLREALESGQIAQGRQVGMAEAHLAEELDAAHVAMTSNGTASLKAGLVAAIAKVRGININYIDRELRNMNVVIPAFSFNATLNSVLQLGAFARVVDISREDFCLDPSAVFEAVDDNTAAVMPVDLYGQPADTLRYEDYCRENGIAIIRDAAQAHGAKLNGESIVKHGDAVSLSFYPTKNISAPEGGAVVTDDADIDAVVRIYRNQGMSQRYVYDMSGDNLRMTDIHAAILRPNIGMISVFAALRAENAQKLTDQLSGIEGIITPREVYGRTHVWHQYTVLVEDEFGITRDQLAEELNDRGIGSGAYYPKTMIDHPTFKDHPQIRAYNIEESVDVAKKALSLPVHPGLSDDDIERIASAINDIKEK